MPDARSPRHWSTGFPWCTEWEDELKRLFGAYVAAKQRDSVFDYDDLLLYWREALSAARLGGAHERLLRPHPRRRVPGHQRAPGRDPDGPRARTAPGSPWSATTPRRSTASAPRPCATSSISPACFSPPAAVVALEQNYRSTQPILDAANAVIARASEGFAKNLVSSRASAELPYLVAAADEAAQADYVADRVLDNREAGIDLRRQAVLFRTSHHSALLEIELARRNIPFVKYGGLKFVEAAHVKDVLAILRWAENPRDAIAALPRPAAAARASGRRPRARRSTHVADGAATSPGSPISPHPPPPPLGWPGFCRAVRAASSARDRMGRARSGWCARWYQPHLERLYDYAGARAGDLDQLEQIAATHRAASAS